MEPKASSMCSQLSILTQTVHTNITKKNVGQNTTGNKAWIQTGHFLNIRLQHYCCTNLLGCEGYYRQTYATVLPYKPIFPIRNCIKYNIHNSTLVPIMNFVAFKELGSFCIHLRAFSSRIKSQSTLAPHW